MVAFVPTMKPLDKDKTEKAETKEEEKPVEAAPVVEEKIDFPMSRSSLCLRIRWILTPSPRAISVP